MNNGNTYRPLTEEERISYQPFLEMDLSKPHLAFIDGVWTKVNTNKIIELPEEHTNIKKFGILNSNNDNT